MADPIVVPTALTKEVEKEQKKPSSLGNCDCLNKVDRAVILDAIDDGLDVLGKLIKRAASVLDRIEEEYPDANIEGVPYTVMTQLGAVHDNLEITRARVSGVPVCQAPGAAAKERKAAAATK